MSNEERFDIFNENMERIGSATREEVHSEGYWHQSFHCWLVRKEGGNRYVLFQRRGPDKTVYPNTLDITAAGHLVEGEAPKDGIREINEELGLSVLPEDLIPLGIRCDVALINDISNKEFCHTYLLERNKPLDSYKLQKEEVSGIVQIEVEDGLKLFSGEKKQIPISGYQIDTCGEKKEINIKVTKDDVIPRLDPYYLKIFIMAKRYFNNNPYLVI